MNIRYYFEVSKKYTLILCSVCIGAIATVPGLADYKILLNALIAATALLVLDIFLRILSLLDRIIENRVERYNGISEVIPAIFEIAQSSSFIRRHTVCEIVASTGVNVFPQLKHFILQKINSDTTVKLKLVLYIMDPSLLDELNVNATRESVSHDVLTEINNFNSEYSAQLKRVKISIECKYYRFTPTIHGFMVNRQRYFLSHFYWKGELIGAHNIYFHHSIEDPEGREHIRCFSNWIDHAKKLTKE